MNPVPIFVLASISIAVIKLHDKKQLSEKTFLFQFLSLTSYSITEGSGGRNSTKKKKKTYREEMADAVTMEECCFAMTCSICFLKNAGPPVHGHSYPPWDGPSHINHHLRKCSTDFHRGQFYEGIFSIEVPLPW